jgi:hypothetical protein
MSGGSRLDVPWNLIALCFICHGKVHNGKIKRCDLLEIIGEREGMTVGEIMRRINEALMPEWRRPCPTKPLKANTA